MVKNYPGERWKTVRFDFEYSNNARLEVSNFGRLRTFNKVSNGNIIQGSMIEGYRIVRLKFYHPRGEKIQSGLDQFQQKVYKLARNLKSQIINKEDKQSINETSALLESQKNKLSKKYQNDLKQRRINYHSLIHRLVAEYFLPKPTSKQTIVAHLDHNKLNNRSTNLKWMTPEENYEHQQKSPHVLADKAQRQERQQSNTNRAKLTVTKIMLLKKLLNEGRPMKQLVKQFKVSETQILRIKRGENWGNIPAAK